MASLFAQLISAENLFMAWQKFARGKHGKRDVLFYERRLEENLFTLQSLLSSDTYQHGAYQAFRVHDPKERQIHKATVQDRVVHQALVNVIEPLFERSFITDSFSCRVGKGTHAAFRRVRQLLARASENNHSTVYALKCDVKKFFASVDHALLFTFLERRITDPAVLVLVQHIINSFQATPGKGLPLGNLTSQLFANVYLHEFDRFIKHSLREKWYARYCDDFVIIHPSRQYLVSLIPELHRFLAGHLRLSLHPNKIFIRSWVQGIDFVGYVVQPHATVLRPKTRRRLLRRVNETNISSYLGLCQHADAFELQEIIRNKVGRDIFLPLNEGGVPSGCEG